MQDRPSSFDLLEAIAEFLIKEIYPAVKEDSLLAYKTLVSWNMLGVLSREEKQRDHLLRQELEELAALQNKKIPDQLDGIIMKTLWKTWLEELTQRIRTNKIENTNSPEWHYVYESLKRKLIVSNPRFSLTDTKEQKGK